MFIRVFAILFFQNRLFSVKKDGSKSFFMLFEPFLLSFSVWLHKVFAKKFKIRFLFNFCNFLENLMSLLIKHGKL